MQAIVFDHPGEPENVLALRDVSSPSPNTEEVLINVSARPIQPADFLFIQGRYRVKPEFPQVAGLEGVGTIVSCGAGVSKYKEGDRVAFRSKGTWGEYALAPTSRVYPVSPKIPDSVACQFSLNPLTSGPGNGCQAFIFFHDAFLRALTLKIKEPRRRVKGPGIRPR